MPYQEYEAFTIKKIGEQITQQIVSVATSPTKLPSTPLTGRRILLIQNLSTVPVYVGGANVAATGSNRGPVMASQYDEKVFEMESSLDLYGVVASGTAEVAVFEAK